MIHARGDVGSFVKPDSGVQTAGFAIAPGHGLRVPAGKSLHSVSHAYVSILSLGCLVYRRRMGRLPDEGRERGHGAGSVAL
jgi:hypothetical protein